MRDFDLRLFHEITLEVCELVTDRVAKMWVSGFGSATEKWGLLRLNNTFLHFLSIVFPYLLIFQSGARADSA